ncbi:uncharacterized protein L969DRAFT_608417 [Mixia osmundae IAM 14324]|uniref:General transcription and DNA repair factor IIH subunit TFB4 n=1 Tax=Mixia osmundae (strain CBS 9802 / IAM 14324 / JCM 22182 / KY 12970) TaxID=764103 RepID=G7DTL6_MIXOS|nr:uncharacterized protein L969DRAFT_608417 [Mixia osmundae IAM 14324]KEI42800.1 hypothetical protein L969DRAFT_608417 [Mixia osmundae IAM 14324]GAA93863.1 hypothetical protein E5Q_00509 [Mixia osmundae IAM 14324]
MVAADRIHDLLCIIIDTNVLAWHESAQSSESGDRLSLSEALETLLVFLNAHLALRDQNELLVYGAGPGHSEMIYSSFDDQGESSADHASETNERYASTFPRFRQVDTQVSKAVGQMMRELEPDTDAPPAIVSALARTLCHINRISREETKHTIKPRVLLLSVSHDSSSQYIPLMNCIFSAQKANVPIDVCKIYGDDAVFLQQAAYLSSGIYYKLEKRAGLLQYLMMTFLPGVTSRKLLNLPSQDAVDLRAACFCHQRIVDIGFVCSVCLSIFCTPRPSCLTCRTKFPLSTLKRLGFGPAKGNAPLKRKRPDGANGTTSPATPAPNTPTVAI